MKTKVPSHFSHNIMKTIHQDITADNVIQKQEKKRLSVRRLRRSQRTLDTLPIVAIEHIVKHLSFCDMRSFKGVNRLFYSLCKRRVDISYKHLLERLNILQDCYMASTSMPKMNYSSLLLTRISFSLIDIQSLLELANIGPGFIPGELLDLARESLEVISDSWTAKKEIKREKKNALETELKVWLMRFMSPVKEANLQLRIRDLAMNRTGGPTAWWK